MIKPAVVITTKDLMTVSEKGTYTLAPGSALRVRLVTAREVGDQPLEGPAVPLYVINSGDPDEYVPRGVSVEAGEPLLFRVVLDRPTTGFIAIPVYVEE